MTVASFDTLKYAKRLQAAGVPAEQAETQADVLADALAVNLKDLVTKDDLAAAKNELTQAIAILRVELKADNRESEQRLGAKFDLIGWMFGALIVIGGGILLRLFLQPKLSS